MPRLTALRRRSSLLRFAPKYLLFVLAAIPCLVVAGPFFARLRAAIHSTGAMLGLIAPTPLEVPVRSLSTLLGTAWTFTLLESDGADGNVTNWELALLNRLAALRAPRRIFEIGTFDGRTILNLAANAPEARAFTLDLPASGLHETKMPVARGDAAYIDKAVSGSRFQDKPEAARITQLLGDSAAFDFSPYLGTIDFVFVDGAHSYDYVIQDTETALALLGPRGGLIVWHDYGVWEGVTEALNHLRRHDPRLVGLYRIEGTALALLEVPPVPPNAQ